MKVSPDIQALSPYQPGKPIRETQREFGLSRVYKLASNENPLGPSPLAVEAIQKNLSELNLYPDASCFELRQACAKKYQVSENFLCFGNGSDELIDLLARIFCAPGEIAVTSACSFAAYKLRTRASRAEIVEVATTQKLGIDLDAIAEWMLLHPQREKARIIFLANPNNPTGTYLSRRQIESFLKEMRQHPNVIVVLDEAYDSFVRAPDFPDSVSLLNQFENLVVLKTLSKVYGLAGLRLGMMVAAPAICDLVNRVRLPFNVNSLAQVAAVAALKDDDYVKRSQEVNWQGLDYFYQQLEIMGLPFVPSQANFVLFDTLTSGQKVYDDLLREGVILRPLAPYKLPQHLRMSVGLQHENEAAIAALKKVLCLEKARSHRAPDHFVDGPSL